MRISIRRLVALAAVAALAALIQARAIAQAPQTAPPGEVVGVGNFAHIVEDLDRSLAAL